MDKEVVIAGYVRSPFHNAKKGLLATIRPDDLVAQTIVELIKRTAISRREIEDLILGCAYPEGEQGLNMARLVVTLADLPFSVGGVTVNRFCGSSMQAIHMAAGAIKMGAGHAFICAGVESMSRVPAGGFNPLPNPALAENFPQVFSTMGETAENLAIKYNISREKQDNYAFNSHKKAVEALKEGRFKDEIIPISIGEGNITADDGCIRRDTTKEAFANLEPAFVVNGTITAGTAAPFTDGASATLVTTEAFAKANGLKILARVRATSIGACDPEVMGLGPIIATQKVLLSAGLELKDIDIIELNETFAVQALTAIEELGIDESKLNLDGGALSLGHPAGASGARVTGKAASILNREGKELALAAMCISGGQGIATVLEAV